MEKEKTKNSEENKAPERKKDSRAKQKTENPKTAEVEKQTAEEIQKTESSEGPAEEKKTKEQTEKKPEKRKKEKAVINSRNAPVSKKYSMDICRFIKNKKIEKAIADLQDVLAHKKAMPMKGEYPHKKTAKAYASGAGKYPKNATEYFIKLLKSLSANASVNGLENPVINMGISNFGQRPRARFGKWQRKSTNITLIATEAKGK